MNEKLIDIYSLSGKINLPNLEQDLAAVES